MASSPATRVDGVRAAPACSRGDVRVATRRLGGRLGRRSARGWAVGYGSEAARPGSHLKKKKDTASKQAASPSCVRCGRAPASRGQYEPSNR